MAKYLLKLKFVVQANILQKMRKCFIKWGKCSNAMEQNKEHNHAKSVSSIMMIIMIDNERSGTN